MSRRRRLMRSIHAAGLRLDDAAVAADVCERFVREERDRLIVIAAREVNLPVRTIATIFGLSHPRIVQVVNQRCGGLPPEGGTL